MGLAADAARVAGGKRHLKENEGGAESIPNLPLIVQGTLCRFILLQ